MTMLTVKQIYVTPPAPAPQPTIPIQFVKPVSYEFRVAEVMEDNKIVKVGLQVQVWEHDDYGSGIVKQYWTDVPRVQMNKNGEILPTPMVLP